MTECRPAEFQRDTPIEGRTYVAPEVADRWSRSYASAGLWLKQLPGIIDTYSTELALKNVTALPGGSISVVCSAEQRGDPVVLKVIPPWAEPSVRDEAAALKAWAGVCAPKLRYSDQTAIVEDQAQLVEKQLTYIEIARLIGRYSIYESPSLPTLDRVAAVRFGRALEDRHALVSQNLWRSAYTAAIKLSRDENSTYGLVHGDLRSKNIMQKDSQLLVIDPEPAMGDIAYDAALWSLEKPDNIEQKCHELAQELDLNPQRVLLWARILAIPEIALASERRAYATRDFVYQSPGISNDHDFWDYFSREINELEH